MCNLNMFNIFLPLSLQTKLTIVNDYHKKVTFQKGSKLYDFNLKSPWNYKGASLYDKF